MIKNTPTAPSTLQEATEQVATLHQAILAKIDELRPAAEADKSYKIKTKLAAAESFCAAPAAKTLTDACETLQQGSCVLSELKSLAAPAPAPKAAPAPKPAPTSTTKYGVDFSGARMPTDPRGQLCLIKDAATRRRFISDHWPRANDEERDDIDRGAPFRDITLRVHSRLAEKERRLDELSKKLGIDKIVDQLEEVYKKTMSLRRDVWADPEQRERDLKRLEQIEGEIWRRALYPFWMESHPETSNLDQKKWHFDLVKRGWQNRQKLWAEKYRLELAIKVRQLDQASNEYREIQSMPITEDALEASK